MRHILIALMLMASQAHAETWLQVADLDKKSGLLLLDLASIDHGAQPRTAWFKTVFTADHPIADGYRDVPPDVRSYRWEADLGHFNCATRTIAVSQSILHGADDKVVGKRDVDASALDFREVAPLSFGGLLLQAVCASSADHPNVGVARLVSIVNPDDYYPRDARRHREAGSPVVKVCVGPSGELLREPEITDPSDFPELDAAAIKVAKANRYAAAVADGAGMPESCIKFKVKFVPLPR